MTLFDIYANLRKIFGITSEIECGKCFSGFRAWLVGEVFSLL